MGFFVCFVFLSIFCLLFRSSKLLETVCCGCINSFGTSYNFSFFAEIFHYFMALKEFPVVEAFL